MGNDHWREGRAPVVTCLRTTRSRGSRVRNRLSVAGKTVRVLENVPRLRGRALRLTLSLSRPLLLCRRFVGLSWSLQDGRLLRRLSMDRLSGQFGVDLRLAWTWLAWVMLRVLLLLVLLGALHDLLGKLTWKPWHARERWLSVGQRHWRLNGRHVLVRRRWCRLHGLVTHHGLDLVKAHHLPRRRSRLLVRLWLFGRCRLLGLETPDIGASLELGDIVGVMVALVAGPGGLGGVEDGRRLVLDVLVHVLLGSGVANLVDHLLLVQRVCNLGRLAGEIKIAADVLLGGRGAAKGVVVEGVVGLIELVAQAIVRLLEVDASHTVSRLARVRVARHTHRHRLPLHRDWQRHRGGRSRGRLWSGPCRGAAWRRTRRKTWRGMPGGGGWWWWWWERARGRAVLRVRSQRRWVELWRVARVEAHGGGRIEGAAEGGNGTRWPSVSGRVVMDDATAGGGAGVWARGPWTAVCVSPRAATIPNSPCRFGPSRGPWSSTCTGRASTSCGRASVPRCSPTVRVGSRACIGAAAASRASAHAPLVFAQRSRGVRLHQASATRAQHLPSTCPPPSLRGVRISL